MGCLARTDAAQSVMSGMREELEEKAENMIKAQSRIGGVGAPKCSF